MLQIVEALNTAYPDLKISQCNLEARHVLGDDVKKQGVFFTWESK